MSVAAEILAECGRVLVLAAPYLLFGLLAAGLVHVLMPARVIERWLGRPGLSGVVAAALLGIPLPVCSCGVVPIAIELRRKKASPPATLSFLTTTPESGVDSIVFTWGVMGPVMAIARPLAAFASAIVAGVLAIAYLPESDPTAGAEPEGGPGAGSHDHGHGHDHEDSLAYGESAAARTALAAWARSLVGRREARSEPETGGDEATSAPVASTAGRPGVWNAALRPALRYGFGTLLAELAFWIVLGLVAAGVLGALLPDDLGAWGLGGGPVPMLLMVVCGIPLYVCASASTPIAAALLAKGLSPGAALVFLLAGPAVNTASLLVLGRALGRRFVQIQLAGVIAGALAAGMALDGLIALAGWRIEAPLAAAADTGAGFAEVVTALLLTALLVRGLWRGGWRHGWTEIAAGARGLAGALRLPRIGRRRLLAATPVLLAAAWLASGFRSVPAGSAGFPLVLGALGERPLAPGLHWLPPAPIGRLEVLRVDYPRKVDVGFRTDLEMLARRADLVRSASPEEWHSPVAAMNQDRERASYLTADENLVEMSFTVHYRLNDPVAFFYRVDHRHDFVALYAESAARRHLAVRPLEELMTVERSRIEKAIRSGTQERLDAAGTGVEVVAVRVVDVHPPGEVVYDFRDVSSALEDKRTTIHLAHRRQAADVPRARGEAALIAARAEAAAAARSAAAAGQAESFAARAEAIAPDRRTLEHLLRAEAAERALAGRDKYVVPPGAAGGEVTLWRREPRTARSDR